MADRSPIEVVWLTVDQASRRSGLHKQSLYRALRAHELVGYQRGEAATWRVHIDDLDAWMRGMPAPSLKAS